MHINDIKSKAEKIKSAFAHITEKRQFWQEETKPLLQRVLRQIAKEADYLDLQVQTLDWTVNSEGVNLLFNSRPSGLFTNRNPTELPAPDSFRHYMKEGGYIVFAQAYNGDVFVDIIYPSVEEHVGEMMNNTLGKYRPSDVTEEMILEKVGVFFDEMLKWETSSSSNTVGFAISRK